MHDTPDLHLARLVANRREPTSESLGTCRALVRRLGSLREVAAAPEPELVAAGLSPRQAARVRSAFGLAEYGLSGAMPRGPAIASAQAAFLRLRHLELEKDETFWAIGLDMGCQEIVPPILIAKGNGEACPLRPADFFAPMVRVKAASAIAVHNHPSGRTEPSPNDIDLTLRLIGVGKVLGVPLADHIVIGGGRFLSLRSHPGIAEHWSRGPCGREASKQGDSNGDRAPPVAFHTGGEGLADEECQ